MLFVELAHPAAAIVEYNRIAAADGTKKAFPTVIAAALSMHKIGNQSSCGEVFDAGMAILKKFTVPAAELAYMENINVIVFPTIEYL